MKNALTAAIIALIASSAHAAPITWSATVIDSNTTANDAGSGLGDGAISTQGTLLEAANFGDADDDLTINGVLFEGTLFSDSLTYLTHEFDNDVSPTSSGDPTTGGQIDVLGNSITRNNGDSTTALQLNGLTFGHTYLVQLINVLGGSGNSQTYDDGEANSINNPNTSPMRLINGVFTADAATQTINITANTGSSYLNGYQLRLVAIPAPAALPAGLALLSMIAIRRRR